MNTKYSREDLLKQLETALDLVGANPFRWPNDRHARLAAFVEQDEEAARRLAEAQALDRVLARAPGSPVRPGFEAQILAASSGLPQDPGAASARIVNIETVGRQSRGRSLLAYQPSRAFWGGAALLAASLITGVFIGATGEAVPTLREIELLAAIDTDAGIAFSGSLFEPSGLHQEGRL